MPRPKGSAELIEARRHQALRLLDEGYTLNEVGRMVDSAASSVMRWRDARERDGEKGLRVRFSPGRPATLTEAQRKRLVKLLLKGALANGFDTELWTTRRVATLIERHCDAQFHRGHVARLLHDLGFSCQKPERPALERDEERIEQWKRSDWPRVKNAARLGAHLVFVDESVFMLIPTVRRTWAPVGQTPTIRHRYNHARISVIGGLSVSPTRRRLGFYFRLHPKNISRDEVHDFLWYLLQHLRGHVIVIWDGASIHHRNGLNEICDRYPRLHLEKLPAYAPELNPIEATWHAVKHPMANGQSDNIPELGRVPLRSLRNAQGSQRVLR